MPKPLTLTVLLLLAAANAFSDQVVLSLYPDNNLTPSTPLTLAGNGDVHGFGFLLVNGDEGWLVVDSVALITDPSPAGDISGWTDLLSNYVNDNSLALAPDTAASGYQLSQDWVVGTSGFGEFQFASSLVGFSGPTVTLELTYDTFTSNPFSDPSAVDMGSSTLDTQVEFDVTAPTPTVPEPAAWALLLTGGILLVSCGTMVRRRRSASCC